MCLCRYGPEKDVADALGISRNTAHVHVARIFQKLGVHDRSAAVRKFLRTLPGGYRSAAYCVVYDRNAGLGIGKKSLGKVFKANLRSKIPTRKSVRHVSYLS